MRSNRLALLAVVAGSVLLGTAAGNVAAAGNGASKPAAPTVEHDHHDRGHRAL
jgi:hypothetical protein